MPDMLTKSERSALMSRIRGKNTGPERLVFAALRKRGLRFSRHVKALPGSPDVVFQAGRVAVFIEGDFWHGWQFPRWSQKLKPYWSTKIASNRARDRGNCRRLRNAGWQVLRVWEHQIDRDLDHVVARVLTALASARSDRRR